MTHMLRINLMRQVQNAAASGKYSIRAIAQVCALTGIPFGVTYTLLRPFMKRGA